MSKPIVFLLMLFLSLAASAGESGEYLASAQGRLTIGTDGHVQAVEITDGESLGAPMLAALEQQVRAWRFEPVLEGGQPVVAIGLMRLELFLQRRPADDSVEFGVRHVWFLDPPGPDGERTYQGQPVRIGPPTYPSEPLQQGVGAKLELLLQLDADGAVEAVTTRQVDFLGKKAPSSAGRLAAAFRRSAETAAKKWRIPGHEAGRVVVIPVRFTPPGTGTWVQRHPAPPQALPEWAVVATATAGTTADLAATGEPVSTRLQLLTPLQPAGG